MEMEVRSLYKGKWIYLTLKDDMPITEKVKKFMLGKHKTMFSGLHDQYAKKLYFGDIVEQTINGHKNTMSVKYQQFYKSGREGVGCNLFDSPGHPDNIGHCVQLQQGLKKIGNIFEHKELLYRDYH